MNRIKDSVLHERLLDWVEVLLEEDLEDARTMNLARRVLKRLQENGHDFVDPDADHECSACLHLSLLSALGLCESEAIDF